MKRRIRGALLCNGVLGWLLVVGCHIPPDCEDTFMRAGDQVRVTVLGPSENGATCGIFPLAPDTAFVRTVVGAEVDPYDGCTGAVGEPDSPALFAPIVSNCWQSSGLGFACEAALQEDCDGRMGMQLAIGTLSKSKPVTDDGLMNVNWSGDDCYAIGCTDQYKVRLEWIPTPKQ